MAFASEESLRIGPETARRPSSVQIVPQLNEKTTFSPSSPWASRSNIGARTRRTLVVCLDGTGNEVAADVSLDHRRIFSTSLFDWRACVEFQRGTAVLHAKEGKSREASHVLSGLWSSTSSL